MAGAISNLTVVDFNNADTANKQIEELFGFRPLTIYQQTCRGLHALFKHCDKLGNRTGIFQGVDIKSEGGFIVAPPSIHKSGKRYKWRDIDPTEVGFGNLLELQPEWIRNLSQNKFLNSGEEKKN